jgi:hypothetical protein
LPDVALSIDLEAVRFSIGIKLPESPRIGNGAIKSGVVVGDDALLSGVLEEKGFLIE